MEFQRHLRAHCNNEITLQIPILSLDTSSSWGIYFILQANIELVVICLQSKTKGTQLIISPFDRTSLVLLAYNTKSSDL